MSITRADGRNNTTNVLSTKRTGWRDHIRMLSVLFKSRVVTLLLLSAIGGAFIGARGWPGWRTVLLVVATGGLAASGSAGLNEYIERGSDSVMRRTRRRPLVTGEVRPRWVFWVSIGMILVPSLAVLPFNPALTFFLLLGAFIYVFIYTIWLKPRTLLNIVIGGAAGSAAVMSGGAAADAWKDPGVIILALLIFLWTPTHFWSLAIMYRQDYARATVPMLPVQTSIRQSAWWVLLHTGATALAALVLTLTPGLGWIYFIPVCAVTVHLMVRNVRLIRDPSPVHARSLFISSNIYLMVMLLALCLGSVVHDTWPPW